MFLVNGKANDKLIQSHNDEASIHETLESPIQNLLPEEATILCFSILWHPDPSRIGAMAPISFDRSGAAILSRLTPDFHDIRAPLLDRHVSRSEIIIEHDNEGCFTFTPTTQKSALIVNGVTVTDRRTFALSDLGQEILVMLGGSVVLAISKAPVQIFHTLAENEAGLIGISESITKTRLRIARLAGTNLPILILGETGTGKELVARAIHMSSGRARSALLTANMAAISPTLASAELFGSRKGAFTGAVADAPGLFQMAHNATLFLDEIGDSPPDVQAILLRALESGEIMPVGGQKAVNVDVRIIAATDKHLDAAHGATNFNQPLFQRLNVAPIELAPLRHRRVDIGLLIRHFLMDDRDGLPTLRAESIAAPEIYRMALDAWPGNVRQLHNAVRRLRLGEPYRPDGPLVPTPAEPIAPPQSAGTVDEADMPTAAYRNPLDISEADLLNALDDCDWVIKEAAKQLRISRTSLYQLMSSSTAIRSIHEVPEIEIVDAMANLDGGINAWAKHLRVGREALRKRITTMQPRG